MSISSLLSAVGLAWSLIVSAVVADHHAHGDADHSHLEPRLISLEVAIEVGRDGIVRVEHQFQLQTDGHEIQRGPVLNFITVSKGLGGLILDDEMQVLEVQRDGKPEPFHTRSGDGFLDLYCGSEELNLDPGVYSYLVRYEARGTWTYRDGKALGSFDLSGPYVGLAIDRLKASIRLPDGVEPEQFSGALSGNEGPGTGYILKDEGSELQMEVDQPLSETHAAFLNVVWPAAGFADQSPWSRILRQHPQLPIAVFFGAILLVALLWMVKRAMRHSPASD